MCDYYQVCYEHYFFTCCACYIRCPPPHIPLDSFWWVEYLVAALQRGANQYFRNILYCTADPPRSLVRASLFILLAKELLWQPSFTAGQVPRSVAVTLAYPHCVTHDITFALSPSHVSKLVPRYYAVRSVSVPQPSFHGATRKIIFHIPRNLCL